MSNQCRSKSQLFLLEFTVVVLFFAVCAAICVSAFVKADQLSKTNDTERQALLQVQGAAEIIKAADYTDKGNVGNDLKKYLEADIVMQSEHAAKYIVYYDEDFQTLTPEVVSADKNVKCKYTMNIEIAYSDEGMATSELNMIDKSSKETVSKLVVKKYLPVIL